MAYAKGRYARHPHKCILQTHKAASCHTPEHLQRVWAIVMVGLGPVAELVYKCLLAVVQQIVLAMGGTIWARHTEPKGLTICIRFPKGEA